MKYVITTDGLNNYILVDSNKQEIRITKDLSEAAEFYTLKAATDFIGEGGLYFNTSLTICKVNDIETK